MTDDPNVEPKPEPDLAPAEGAEEAGDLDAAQLEAAAEGAEDEVGDAGDEEAEALEAAQDETFVLEPGDLQAVPLGAPGGAGIEPEARGPRQRGPKAPSRTAFAIDPALRIQDRASAAFVIITVVVFVLILGNAMLLGSGGALTPLSTPSPQATEAPSESPSASGSPAPSVSTAPTSAPSSSPAGSTVPTSAPSTAPSPAAS